MMSQKLTIVAISLLLLIFNCGAGSAVENEFKYSSNENKQVFTKQVNPVEDFGRIPLYFIPNKGQADASAQFYAKASNYTLWVTKEGLVFDKIRKNESGNTAFPRVKSDIKNHSEADPYWNAKEGSIETVTKARVKGNTGCQYERNVSRLSFIGANENPKISAGEATDYRVNYFMGNDKRNWRTDIETSASIIYENLYENIDFKVYGLEKQIEYDWIVRPGADPNKILFEYRNVKSIKIAEDGNLVVHTAFGDLVHKKPAGYQIIRGERVEVNVEFKKSSNRSYGFKVSEYNKDYPLIIDPLIVDYSTYLGGLSGQIGRGIAVDSSGSAYVAGYTSSSDFPMLNQYQGDQGTTDAFVTKLTPAGNGLAYSTYLGGGDQDYGYAIAVDSSGSAYVTGCTISSDFPMLNQYQGDQGATDAFVTKLTPSGNGLAYSTYLGGSGNDYGNAIAVDSSGSAYVTGYTSSANFPTLNQYQGSLAGVIDAFVTKLTPAGNMLAYSTYIGGSGNDYGNAIAVDSSGSAYVAGETLSADFPTVNQYQGSLAGTTDAFVTKLAPAGNTLAYSTYLGGGGGDYGHAIAVDSSGSAYVTGYTSSANFPTLNQYQGSLAGTTDAFVTKLTHAGNSLVYSTYLGGGGQDNGNAIAVDSSGSAYVTGETLSADFPTVNQYQGPQGNYDVFVTKITPAGNSLYYSTYLGGNSMDNVRRIAVDSSGSAYVTGETYSSDFPTVNQYQGSLAGAYDVFVTKLTWQNPNTEPTAVITADRFGGIAPLMIAFDGSGSYDRDGRVVDWMWNFGDGTTGTGEQITHEYTSPGTYNVTLSVRDNDGEWSRPAQETVLVLNDTESLICVIEIIPNSFKANGKATGIIVATLYQKSQDDSGSADLLLTNIGLKFSPAKGSLSGDMLFENSSGKYSMILVSGEPGTDTVSAILDGFTLASSNVVYTWPQPPLNLNVVMKEDRGLFKGVYYSYLYWSANTSDIYAPALYKIYRSTNGSAFENIGTTNASTFEYVDSNVAAGKNYTYAVSTVDVDGDESALSAPVNAY
jgi:PKD repeat protein